jgi:hypothetical protein
VSPLSKNNGVLTSTSSKNNRVPTGRKKCPVCNGSKYVLEADQTSDAEMATLLPIITRRMQVVNEPDADDQATKGFVVPDYRVTVVFERSGPDDQSVVDDAKPPLWPGLPLGRRLANQLAVELQQAYDLTHMGGHFSIIKVDFGERG